MSAAARPAASARETAFGGEVELRFPFSEALVDDLKTEIPGRYRRWDPDAKVWRVMGAYAPAAVDLLLAHFPRAEVPGDLPRRMSSISARTERSPTPPRPPVPPAPPKPPIPFSGASEANDQPERDTHTISVPCPRCHEWFDQPVRVVGESSLTVARRETAPPELIAVCPHCAALVIVAFHPAVAGDPTEAGASAR